ncbi:MAG: hypothetical protein IPN95_19460 [Bacteroidetes bacterium]|nr:hypothetical protein [Bacteroidota bacterium]
MPWKRCKRLTKTGKQHGAGKWTTPCTDAESLPWYQQTGPKSRHGVVY